MHCNGVITWRRARWRDAGAGLARAGAGSAGRGGWQQADLPPADDAAGWFAGRLPDGWFTGAPRSPSTGTRSWSSARWSRRRSSRRRRRPRRAPAEAGRISRFREDTRDERIAIAREAEHRYGRKVAWGAAAGGTRQLFTTLSAPVMTRLRQPERQVLDTLVDAGVARSRSEALAWCVRLVGEHAEELAGRAARGDGGGGPAARAGPGRGRAGGRATEATSVVPAGGAHVGCGPRVCRAAAVFEGPGNIRIQHVPDPEVELPTDAVVRVVAAGICGTDLWSYRGYGQRQPGERIGHEFIGVVTDVGPDVRTVRPATW